MKPVLEKLSGQIGNLPTLPQVVEQVMTLIENPDTTSAQLADVISTDQALMTKVLKVVNSAYYGMPRRIATLRQATVILGFNTVKNLVLSASIFDSFGSGQGDVVFDRVKFWEHSVAVGTAAKILAQRIRLGEPEELFVAGLLHDVGKVVIDDYLHEEFVDILRTVRDKKCRILEAEREVLGIGHPQVGQMLAEKWNLPDTLTQAIAYHHEPKVAGNAHKKFVAIVHLADAIARLENLGFGGDSLTPVIDPESWSLLGIPELELGELILKIKEEFKKASVFLSLV